MKERYFKDGLSPVVEAALWLFTCAFIILGIIISTFTFGPIGAKGAASHAMAGVAELGIIIGVVCLTVTIIITRMVYRAWPLRWLRTSAIIYPFLIFTSLGVGFIDVLAGVVGVAVCLIVGLAASLLLGIAYFVRKLRT